MNALNPVRETGKQIAEPIQLHEGLSEAKALVRARELFELVGINPKRVMDFPHQLSGGMRQRAMIAMALACNPKLVIGDEPTTALDVMVQAQILELIERLRKELDLSFILISHDLSVMAETCDKGVIMYAGEVVECGHHGRHLQNARTPTPGSSSRPSPTSTRSARWSPRSRATRPTCSIRRRAATSIRAAT